MSSKESAICKTCGDNFLFYRSTLRGKDASFCSRKCIQLVSHNKGQRNQRLTKKCVECSNCFETFVSMDKTYCSKKCVLKGTNPTSHLKPMLGKDNPAWKGGKNKCLDCKKQLSNRYGIRCKECFPKAMEGKNAPNWKGGVTSENNLQRKKFRQKIQKQIFKRDNYTCTLCNVKGGYLQVDHIQSWAEYAELRFSLDNCRTLCMDCHYFITFGKKKPQYVKTWGHNLIQKERMVL